MDMPENVMRQIGRVDLTFSQVQELVGWENDNTMRKRLARFFTVYGFQPNVFKREGHYVFPAEWNGLFLTLLYAFPDHPEFHEDQRKQSSTLERRERHEDSLRYAMARFLTEEDRLDLETEAPSLASLLEAEVVERFEESLRCLRRVMDSMPSIVRVRVLSDITRNVINIRRYLEQGLEEHKSASEHHQEQGEQSLAPDNLHELLQHRLRFAMLHAEEARGQAAAQAELDKFFRDMDSPEDQARVDAAWEKIIHDSERAARRERDHIVKKLRAEVIVSEADLKEEGPNPKSSKA